LTFTHAVGGDHVPSTGEYDPHIHVFLELEDGSSIAFFEVPRAPGGMKDDEMHDWIQHFAFEVADEATLLDARERLVARGLDVLGPVDHGFIRSIYFHDPSGHRLELTCRTATDADRERFAEEAPGLLELWDKTHDWSGATVGIDVHR
jgi:catechol 2,3-dioxygenase-like lactoylglutathione lyase family enzyme